MLMLMLPPPTPPQAMFRKEDCGDLLTLRDADTPETTGNERKTTASTSDYQRDERHPKGTMQVTSAHKGVGGGHKRGGGGGQQGGGGGGGKVGDGDDWTVHPPLKSPSQVPGPAMCMGVVSHVLLTHSCKLQLRAILWVHGLCSFAA